MPHSQPSLPWGFPFSPSTAAVGHYVTSRNPVIPPKYQEHSSILGMRNCRAYWLICSRAGSIQIKFDMEICTVTSFVVPCLSLTEETNLHINEIMLLWLCSGLNRNTLCQNSDFEIVTALHAFFRMPRKRGYDAILRIVLPPFVNLDEKPQKQAFTWMLLFAVAFTSSKAGLSAFWAS